MEIVFAKTGRARQNTRSIAKLARLYEFERDRTKIKFHERIENSMPIS